MKIAYLVNQYPGMTHSFIRREIVALEFLGVDVARYTLRKSVYGLADEADLREFTKTAAVIERPVLSRVLSILGIVASHPLRFAKTLGFAFQFGYKSDRSIAVHVAYLFEAAVVAAWCKRDRIEHLHVHFGTNSATVGMFASWLARIPWSFTAHGPEEFDRPRGIGLAEKIESAKFVVAISSFGRSQLWRWVKHSEWKKINVVRCGLDILFLDGDRVPLPTKPRLVCVGRLFEQKGQLLLVEAAQMLRRKGIEFEIVFAGDGPLRAEIELMIAEANLGDCISITGWISGRRVREEIEKARALIIPSFAEGLPVVIMEAMALERPVVSTMVAGIPELVSHGETGWLVPAGDVTALIDAVAQVLSSTPEKLAAMGKRGRERAVKDHDALKEAAKLKQLFEGQGT